MAAIAIDMRQKKVAQGNKKLIDKNYNMLLKEKNPYIFANYKILIKNQSYFQM